MLKGESQNAAHKKGADKASPVSTPKATCQLSYSFTPGKAQMEQREIRRVVLLDIPLNKGNHQDEELLSSQTEVSSSQSWTQ